MNLFNLKNQTTIRLRFAIISLLKIITMEDLKWQYQKTDINLIYSTPTHGIKYEVIRRSDTSFICRVPLSLAVVTCLELFYDNPKAARDYCNMLWRTWGYLTVRRKLIEYQNICQPSLQEANVNADLKKLYDRWIKSISGRNKSNSLRMSA